MIPTFATGLVHPSAILPPDAFAMAFPESVDHTPPCGDDYAVIAIGTRQRAQGPILRRHRDGRVSIDAGGRTVTGHLTSTRKTFKSWWTRLGGGHML